jgi:hypothetical protein
MSKNTALNQYKIQKHTYTANINYDLKKLEFFVIEIFKNLNKELSDSELNYKTQKAKFDTCDLFLERAISLDYTNIDKNTAIIILCGLHPNIDSTIYNNINIKKIAKFINSRDDLDVVNYDTYTTHRYSLNNSIKNYFANNEYMPMGEFLAWALENKFLKKHQSSNTAKATETRKKINISRNQKIIKKYNTLIKQDKYKTNQSLVASKIIKDLDLTIKERAVKNIINTYLKKQ